MEPTTIQTESSSSTPETLLEQEKEMKGPTKLVAKLDFADVAARAEELARQLSRRGAGVDGARVVRELLEARERRLEAQRADDELRQRRNAGQAVDRSEMQRNKARLDEATERLERLAMALPNWTHPDVPVGSESAARVVASNCGVASLNDLPQSTSSSPPTTKKPKDHLQLAEKRDWIDFSTGAWTSGTKFAFLKGKLARLEMGLQSLALRRLEKRGFTPVATPDLVRTALVEACGFQPRGHNTQVYHVADSDLCLVGTSEIPLAGSFAGKRLTKAERLAGFGHCFRTEAGAPGAASKGLYRLHQFSKVEMFVGCPPTESEAIHKELLGIATEWCTDLGLAWRALDMPTEELGASAWRKFDVEVWMPGLARWGEVASITNCTDFQARRLDVKMASGGGGGGGGGGPEFAHTLNGTACAVPRTLVALMETHQRDDGSIVLPPVVAEEVGWDVVS